MAASALALLSNQVVKTTIRQATTIQMNAATARPKMPAAIAPREALVGSETRLPRGERRPWLAAEISSSEPSMGRAKENRFPMLLSISGHSTHCHPPKGPVNAVSGTQLIKKQTLKLKMK